MEPSQTEKCFYWIWRISWEKLYKQQKLRLDENISITLFESAQSKKYKWGLKLICACCFSVLSSSKLEKTHNAGSNPDSQWKYLSGEWFYEAKSRRHMDKFHGSEIILASMEAKKALLGVFALCYWHRAYANINWVHNPLIFHVCIVLSQNFIYMHEVPYSFFNCLFY